MISNEELVKEAGCKARKVSEIVLKLRETLFKSLEI